jgi:hypothetical protein
VKCQCGHKPISAEEWVSHVAGCQYATIARVYPDPDDAFCAQIERLSDGLAGRFYRASGKVWKQVIDGCEAAA